MQRHWDDVYAHKDVGQVSWYEPVPEGSLEAITRVGTPDDAVLDVGAGASLLVDHLLARGWRDVSLLDISPVALALTRTRLPTAVPTFVGDIRTWQPPRAYDCWHDRAVFHFMTTDADVAAYRSALLTGLAPGGHAIVQAFHRDGPDRCSDLPTARYDAAGLHRALGGDAEFILLDHDVYSHPHPRGGHQMLQRVVLQRR